MMCEKHNNKDIINQTMDSTPTYEFTFDQKKNFTPSEISGTPSQLTSRVATCI
jgi:hypothetical protein